MNQRTSYVAVSSQRLLSQPPTSGGWKSSSPACWSSDHQTELSIARPDTLSRPALR
jgi:hypothetical protein